MTKDYWLVELLKENYSEWRIQKNGLPRKSVIAPIIFKFYTNDQPSGKETEHFIYVDDLVVQTQGDKFETKVK